MCDLDALFRPLPFYGGAAAYILHAERAARHGWPSDDEYRRDQLRQRDVPAGQLVGSRRWSPQMRPPQRD